MVPELKDVKMYLFDLDGTIYLGDEEIEGSYAAVQKLRDMGKKVCVFTNNSSRSHNDYIERLNKMGFAVTDEEVYTSGEVTCDYLKENYAGKRVFLLGNERLSGEFLENGINLVQEDPDIVVLAFDTSLTYDKLYKFCTFVAKGLPYVATHPDYFCPGPIGPMPDAGALIDAVKDVTGRAPDFILGKPYPTAGELIRRRFGLEKHEVAMVGDRLYTDIAFGINCGFVSILVFSGETTKKQYEQSKIKADFAFDFVKDIPVELEK